MQFMPKNDPIVVFFGTSHFAVPILKKMIDSPFCPKLVLTQPDALIGRKKFLMSPPVKECAAASGISVIQPETLKSLELEKILTNLNPDLFILAAYGRIIPRKILEIPRLGFLNVHPSLLPFLRGASPIQSAILEGLKETGTTIIKMDEELDHGPILAQEKISLSGSENYEELSQALANLSSGLLLRILPNYIDGQIKPADQSHHQATFTEIIKPEDARIDWKKPAENIERMARAYHLWPKAHTFWKKTQEQNSRRINLLKTRVVSSSPQFEPGKVLGYENGLAVVSGSNLLIIDRLHLEGKKETDAQSFLRGHSDIIGAVLR